ncbi:TetR/AcrR family transcriptional regulator [Flavisphingomonas formosensis]|uniref:TetR/AcrR family transcriptional regulator n=1 Tax=Flavisphingomonas formosensis TaxID=861534 RepID=UPI0012F9F902|nr:TetR/AcrR family transcriptional regulator [Sphingomonas formosensis]
MNDTDKPTISRREQSKQNRRDAIVQAARASFLENGYAGTSMSALVHTLGGSKQTLWSYFRSKEELFAAVIEEVTSSFRAELSQLLTGSDDLQRSLLDFCRSFLRRLDADDAVAAWRLVAGESGRFPEVGRIFYERAVRLTETTLAQFLARFIASGELREESAPRMAELLLGLCASRQNKRLWGVGTGDEASREADAIAYSGMFLRAFAREKG